MHTFTIQFVGFEAQYAIVEAMVNFGDKERNFRFFRTEDDLCGQL